MIEVLLYLLQIAAAVPLMLAIYYVRTAKEKEIVKNLAKKWRTKNRLLYTICRSSVFWRTSHATWKIPLMFHQKIA